MLYEVAGLMCPYDEQGLEYRYGENECTPVSPRRGERVSGRVVSVSTEARPRLLGGRGCWRYIVVTCEMRACPRAPVYGFDKHEEHLLRIYM